MLSAKQQRVSEVIVENLKRGLIQLYELPTGFGKSTYVLPHIANELAAEKRVILSTFTNSLAYKLFCDIKGKYPELNAGFVIGAANYLDLNKIDDEFYSYFVYPDKVREYVKALDKNTIFEEIFADCLIGDDDKNTVTDIYCANDRKELDGIDDYGVIVTNHTFLLASSHSKDLSGFYVLLDEVDRMPDAQKLLSMLSFSIYRFATSLKKFIKTAKADKKYLWQIYKEAEGIMESYRSIDRIDLYIADNGNNLFRSYISSLSEFASKRKKLRNLSGKYKTNRQAKIFLKEYNELNVILKNADNISLYYSPVKGYPTVHYLSQKVQFGLFDFFEKLNGCLGVSGTLFTVPKPDIRSRLSSLDDGGYIKDKLGLNVIIKGQSGEVLKSLKDKVDLKWITRVFPVQDVKIHLNYPVKKKDAGGEDGAPDGEWTDGVCANIADTYEGKNSLVVAGSYAEAKAIHKRLAELLPGENIVCADFTTTQKQTLDRFKKEGGILVGTRTYATGIDLPGGELEKLYLVKLLFPPINDKDLQDKKAYNQGAYWNTIYNDMLFMTRQAIGRLQRRAEDKGDIYIMDERIDEARIKERLERIFKDAGVIQKELV